MRARRSRHAHTPHPPQDRWLLSYADFITVLFAFFTALYASSTVDANKMAIVADGLQRAFDAGDSRTRSGQGVLPGNRGLITPGSNDPKEQILRRLAKEIQSGQLELSEDGRGLVLSLPQATAFPVGGTTLSPQTAQAISHLASILDGIPNTVRVEGHTDDVPIHTARFTSNWELSTDRAVRVVEYLIEQGHVPPERLSAAGYSAYHPRVPNDSETARAKNRRVDIVIVGATAAPSPDLTPKGSTP
ncbi:MAG: flagellar motor protein MotB [Acidobacteriota bacterium]